MEAKLLAAMMHDRRAYEYVRAFIRESDLSERGWRIYQELDAFYTRDLGATVADSEVVRSRLHRSLAEKLHAQFDTILDDLAAMNVSGINIAHEFLEIRREAVGHKLSHAINSGTTGDELYTLYDEYGELLDATEIGGSEEVEIDLVELFGERLQEKNKYTVLPGALNKVIGGGVRPGDTMLVFGRPNAGKSTFVLNLANGFVRRGLTVLFIENEDSRERTLSRFIRRLIERNEDWCLSNPEQVKELAYRGNARERFHLYKLTPGTPSAIEALVRRIKPDVLIVNQLRGIASAMPGKMTANLEKAAIELRNIGQRYDLVTILVTQANAGSKDAQGQVVDKPILHMEDIDSSLTGVPGATDFIIGVGSSRQLRAHKTAVLSVVKSKAKGDGEYVYVDVDTDIDKVYSRGL